MSNETTTNQLLIPYFNFQGHSRAPSDVAFSSEGKIFASSTYDGTIKACKRKFGKIKKKILK